MKQIGSNDALAQVIQDVIAAFFLDDMLVLTCDLSNRYNNIAPDSNTVTSSSSAKHGICPNGCGFFDKSPRSNCTSNSYAAPDIKRLLLESFLFYAFNLQSIRGDLCLTKLRQVIICTGKY